MRQAGEPTVEEILESIKKVIARDNRASAEERRPDLRPIGDADPIDASAAAPGADEDVLDLADAGPLDPDQAGDVSGSSGLAAAMVNEQARVSMRESLAALAILAEPSAPPQIVRSGETSLEGMVRELLKPALAEWLDKNLPPLVESMVAAEISRIVGKRG